MMKIQLLSLFSKPASSYGSDSFFGKIRQLQTHNIISTFTGEAFPSIQTVTTSMFASGIKHKTGTLLFSLIHDLL